MFETIKASWQTVEFVALWSSLSLGTVVGLASLFYFVAPARKLAIQIIILVIVAWSCLMHGHIAGRADEQAALKIISDDNDKAAATNAAADDKTLSDQIAAKAKVQHEQDLGEIASLGAGCAFDPGADGVQPPTASVGAGAVNGKPKPAVVAKAPVKSAGGAATGQGLHFPLVWPRWLQGKKSGGDAPANSQ